MSEFEIPTRTETARLILRMFREEDWRSMSAVGASRSIGILYQEKRKN